MISSKQILYHAAIMMRSPAVMKHNLKPLVNKTFQPISSTIIFLEHRMVHKLLASQRPTDNTLSTSNNPLRHLVVINT